MVNGRLHFGLLHWVAAGFTRAVGSSDSGVSGVGTERTSGKKRTLRGSEDGVSLHPSLTLKLRSSPSMHATSPTPAELRAVLDALSQPGFYEFSPCPFCGSSAASLRLAAREKMVRLRGPMRTWTLAILQCRDCKTAAYLNRLEPLVALLMYRELAARSPELSDLINETLSIPTSCPMTPREHRIPNPTTGTTTSTKQRLPGGLGGYEQGETA